MTRGFRCQTADPRTLIEQAIARGEQPSRIMARQGITYEQYRAVADSMLTGSDEAGRPPRPVGRPKQGAA